jgi:cell division septal protein FtsQ
VLVVVLAWRGIELLPARTSAHPRFSVDPLRCRVSSPSPWLTPEDLESIRSDSGLLGARFSIFTPGLADRFARGYERSAWVRRAVVTRRRYPNRVDVHLEIRKPVAAARLEDGTYVLVDEEGIRLPGTRGAPKAGPGRPIRLLDGVADPTPEPGSVWSEQVREEAAVARTLLDLPEEIARAVRITAIDLENSGGRVDPARAEILLVTQGGTVIEWGRSRVSPRAALEPAAQAKFEKLRRALRVYPALSGLSRLKLQFDDLVVEEKDGPGHAEGG